MSKVNLKDFLVENDLDESDVEFLGDNDIQDLTSNLKIKIALKKLRKKLKSGGGEKKLFREKVEDSVIHIDKTKLLKTTNPEPNVSSVFQQDVQKEEEEEEFPSVDPYKTVEERRTEVVSVKMKDEYSGKIEHTILPVYRICPYCEFFCARASDGCKHTRCGNPACGNWFCHCCLRVPKKPTNLSQCYKYGDGSNVLWKCGIGMSKAYSICPTRFGRVIFPTQTQENRKDWLLKIMPQKENEGGTVPDQKIVCTFKLTGRKFTFQKWYNCAQCFGSNPNSGCCEVCANVCHKGHNGLKEAFSSPSVFFCDCGAERSECRGMMSKNLESGKDVHFVCTFKLTGRKYAVQRWYNCPQCFGSNPNSGCCEVCAKVCHKGHNGLQEAFSSPSGFYCDCGAGRSDCKAKGMAKD